MTQWFVPRAFARQREIEARVGAVQPNLPLEVSHRLRYLMAKGMPYEVGGLIFNDNRVCEYPNTASNPEHAFDIEADVGDLQHIFAVWHTHPTGPDKVSADDVECMMEMYDHGLVYPWIVVSPTTITRWEIDIAAATA